MSDFTMSDTLNQAWEGVNGSKKGMWCLLIIVIALLTLIQFIMIQRFDLKSSQLGYWSHYVFIPILTNLIFSPFYGGLLLIALRRARHQKIYLTDGFSTFKKYIPITITLIAVTVTADLPNMIIHAPWLSLTNITLTLADILSEIYSVLVRTFLVLSILLVIDKHLSPWRSLIHSLRLVSPHWFKVLVVMVTGGLCLLAASIPFMLGIILQHTAIMLLGCAIILIAAVWLLPFIFMIVGSLYHALVDKTAV